MKCLLIAAAVLATGSVCEQSRPSINGVSHVALNVSDLTAARLFYKEFLGFAEEPFTLKNGDGSERIVFIKINDTQHLELFAEPPGPKARGKLNHFSLTTADATGIRDYLTVAGMRLPQRVRIGTTGNKIVEVADPDGYRLEFVEYLADSWTSRGKGKHMPETRIATRLGHVALESADLARSLNFYRNILGLEETVRGRETGDEIRPWLTRVNLRVPGGADYLKLVSFDNTKGSKGEECGNHVGLVVPDVQRALDTLNRGPARASYRWDLSVQVNAFGDRRLLLFDPDETCIELAEAKTATENTPGDVFRTFSFRRRQPHTNSIEVSR